jgi:hypothetical protein
MKCLILIFGESFRTGSQYSRIKGEDTSYEEQMNACRNHIKFFKYIEEKYNIKVSVSLLTYTTKFDKDLINNYKDYLIKFEILKDLIGLNGLFHKSYSNIMLDDYDFILYFRVDLFLKDYFFEIFNPNWNTINFATILWLRYQTCYGYPSNNDMIIFIPRKYYKYLNNFNITHCTWRDLIKTTDLTNNDLDTMINTFHDSDSQKDLNPLYYIVNRPQNTIWHDNGYIFNKSIFTTTLKEYSTNNSSPKEEFSNTYSLKEDFTNTCSLYNSNNSIINGIPTDFINIYRIR